MLTPLVLLLFAVIDAALLLLLLRFDLLGRIGF